MSVKTQPSQSGIGADWNTRAERGDHHSPPPGMTIFIQIEVGAAPGICSASFRRMVQDRQANAAK